MRLNMMLSDGYTRLMSLTIINLFIFLTRNRGVNFHDITLDKCL